MIATKSESPVFHEGDEVVLALGTHTGTTGTFLRLKEDVNWADIVEQDGSIRSHPVVWLALCTGVFPMQQEHRPFQIVDGEKKYHAR